ncbi:MAG: GIY-YIG nuclease family protein [Gammaproteobacteria bacterium]|nr:GIY-YIG nuclease family protein [Gammaproteobacteria bacterium]
MWQLYIIRCRDNSLYTGVTKDVTRRFQEHSTEGAACAKYLRGKGPFTLVYTCAVGSRPEALRAEHRVKSLSKEAKERLVCGIAALADLT